MTLFFIHKIKEYMKMSVQSDILTFSLDEKEALMRRDTKKQCMCFD